MKLNYRQAYGIFKVNRVKGGSRGMKEIEILKIPSEVNSNLFSSIL